MQDLVLKPTEIDEVAARFLDVRQQLHTQCDPTTSIQGGWDKC